MTRHRHAFRIAATRPRGSVLIFALVLLMLLLGVGVAFMLSVRQSATASANAMRTGVADATLQSGEDHALRMIREAVHSYTILSPDGLFVPVGPTRPFLLDDAASPSGFPQRNLYRAFEAYPGDTTVAQTIGHKTDPTPRLHAWLWWHPNNTFCKTYDLETDADPALRFTEGYLTHDAAVDGSAARYYHNGPEHAGLARQFFVRGHVEDLYAGMNDKLRVTTTRGEYYVWIVDLDGKLNVYPQVAPNGWALTDQANFSAWAAAPSAKDTAQGIFNKLGTDTGNNIDFGTAVVFDKVWTLPAGGHHSVGDFFTHLDVNLGALSEEQQLRSRYGLDRGFTFLNDHALTAGEAAAWKVPPYIKPHATALNVNTAAPETIAAAFSRIPLVENYDPANAASQTDNSNKALRLARRVCAKRPFLSPIDFEDFLAAHLNTYPVSGADDASTGTGTPVWMIKQAIPKRQELTLVQFMGLDDVQIDGAGLNDAELLAQNPQLADVEKKASMEARFAFFRAEDALAPLYTSDADNALISVQAFNNLLNSVSGLRRDGTFAYSYYSLDIERIDDDGDGTVDYQEVVQRPFEKTVTVGANPYTIVPKFNYQPLDATAIAGGTKTYAVDGAGAGTLVTWYATKASGYYEMVFHAYDDTQEIAVGEPVPAVVPPTPPPPIIGGGPDTALNTPVDGDDTVAGADIVDGGDTVAQAFVHGPLRAYRNLGAEDTSVNPAPTAVSTDGPNSDGDVAWSPRVCFRGRFFKIYVLARSITAIDAAGVYHYGSTRRSEIVYDALADRVLWRREPATEKHALGDPSVAP